MKHKLGVVPLSSQVNDGGDSDDIMLFTRQEGGNYVCLGRLGLSGCDLSKEPISMQWELLDYDQIKDSADFKDILKASL